MTSFSSRLRHCRLALSSLLLTVLLTACGGGNDAPANYSLGGSVTGLSGGTLVLQVNDGETVSVSADGAFQFPSTLPGGTAYVVSVQTQPNNPAQTCSVNRGSGTLNAAVSDIVVLCAPNAYRIGGTVSGLAGEGLVLQNNGGDDLAVSADGGFRFIQPVASGARYSITVKTQPSDPAQTCTVNDASALVADHDIDNVTVQCSTDVHPIGGSVTGLTGKGLVLQNNAGDDLNVSADGHFQFATPVASGAGYVVMVRTQPHDPSQTCSVDRGTGTVADQDITDIKVRCATNAYRIGGTVSGLVGSGLVLQNNGGDDLVMNADGSFRFAQPVASGAAYHVTVKTQPVASGAIVKTLPIAPAQTCTVSQTSSIVADADVTDVRVLCSTNSYTVGGTVSGYNGSGLVLKNNGGNALAIAGNGAFQFTQPVVSGASYTVTVYTQPSGQVCSVDNNSGTIGHANVTNVQVNCAAASHTVSGTISGLVGSVTLQNNGDDGMTVSSDGSWIFHTPVAVGSTYAVTVATQPATQTCTVNNGSDTMHDANVTNVEIICATNTYTVGGSVSGLAGSGLVLQNNGGDNLSISTDGAWTFAMPVASGSSYNVTVLTQPAGQDCTVSNGSGTVDNANVTNVQVTCTTNTYSVGVNITGLNPGGPMVTVFSNADNVPLSTDHDITYSFPSKIPVGSPYSVTILVQPAPQFCHFSNDLPSVIGTMPEGDVLLPVVCDPLG